MANGFDVRVTSNIPQWLAKLEQRRKVLERKLKLAPDQVAEWGVMEAARIAPKDTTNLAQAISWKGTKDNRALVLVRSGFLNPKGGRPATKYGAVMHNTPLSTAQSIWRSGDPHFMFTIRKGASERLRRKVVTAVGEFTGGRET